MDYKNGDIVQFFSGTQAQVVEIERGKGIRFMKLELIHGAWPKGEEILREMGCKGGGWVTFKDQIAEIWCI